MKKEIKIQAIKLRKLGFSLPEISKKCDISKSTASVWLRNVRLNGKAKNILWKKGKDNWKKGNYARKIKKQILLSSLAKHSVNYLDSLKNIDEYYKLLCALLYWCEGSKTHGSVKFTNSDPVLLSLFLKMFRAVFDVNESKFRVILHLHSYHDDLTQKRFWSKITSVPISQFMKSYRKKNGGKNIRPNYQGCVSVSYFDYKIFEELIILCKKFVERI